MKTTLAATALAFLAGLLVAAPDDKWAALASELLDKQNWLLKDLEKVERACGNIEEIRATRAAGIYEISADEKRLERKAQQDFHIFLERSRNSTLEALQLFDVALGARQADPLQAVFGKALNEVIEVEFREEALEDVVSQLEHAYKVQINVRGDSFSRRTMSLHGEMSLRSILEHIEHVFCVRLTVEKGKLWFVPTGKDPEAE